MRKFVYIGTLLLMIACGRAPQIRYYTLDIHPSEMRLPDQSPGIVVAPFRSQSGYDQDRLIYRNGDHEIQSDPYRRWITPPPQLLREKLVAFLRGHSGQNVMMMAPRDTAFSILQVDIVQFEEGVSDGRRQALIKFWCELNTASGQRIWSGYVTGHCDLQGSGVEAILDAMEQAVTEAFGEVAKQLSIR